MYMRLSSQQQHYREGTRRKRRWCMLSMSSCRNCTHNRHIIHILVLAEGVACSALVLAETVYIKHILPLLPKLPPPLPFAPPHAPRNRTFPKRLIGMPCPLSFGNTQVPLELCHGHKNKLCSGINMQVAMKATKMCQNFKQKEIAPGDSTRRF
jgi:hypothetical protein